MWTLQGKVLRKINGGMGGQSNVTGLKEDKDLENCPFIKDLNFPKVWLSLKLTCAPFHVYSSFQ